jgi:hypothetical protein
MHARRGSRAIEPLGAPTPSVKRMYAIEGQCVIRFYYIQRRLQNLGLRYSMHFAILPDVLQC